MRATTLLARNAPHDLEEVHREVAWLRTQLPTEGASLDMVDATARWFQGDVATTYAALVAANAQLLANWKPVGGVAVHGLVVDARGAPIAGASVVVGDDLVGDSVGVAVPLYEEFRSTLMQRATTDAHGRFSFASAPRTAI